jgi:hypothetical protein
VKNTWAHGVIWRQIFTLKAGATAYSKCVTAKSHEEDEAVRLDFDDGPDG